MAFVGWAGDPTLDGASTQELLDTVPKRAVGQLVDRGAALRATLASAELLTHAVNSAILQVANEVWPATRGELRIVRS